ncbi:Uncharacterized protein DBV15_11619 [Temnothorax longispinosus]|uniref:Uncharacterized protein n=1 Tax=Temnothorax longispinosus TaxID=300112 RepID=A0A4S2KME0_9HYME|nr:Uncharacterized protein DBV15_11619 [Temnothorax longispinosus]
MTFHMRAGVVRRRDEAAAFTETAPEFHVVAEKSSPAEHADRNWSTPRGASNPYYEPAVPLDAGFKGCARDRGSGERVNNVRETNIGKAPVACETKVSWSGSLGKGNFRQ